MVGTGASLGGGFYWGDMEGQELGVIINSKIINSKIISSKIFTCLCCLYARYAPVRGQYITCGQYYNIVLPIPSGASHICGIPVVNHAHLPSYFLTD